MLVAIPSKSRPWKSKSKEFMKNSGVLFVPQSELDLYCKVYKPSEIVGVPNEVKGITATRNWILQQNIGEDVVFVDDDLMVTGFHHVGYGGDMYKKKFIKFKTEEEVLWQFEKGFDTCKSLGWKIWGARTESMGLSARPEKPFQFRRYITASCMGIVNDGTMMFDERFRVKEDYEIGLRHIQMFGGVLGIDYFVWQNSHWTDEGGCKDYRSDKVERDCINLLIKMYPQYIQSVSNKKSQYSIKLNFS